MHTRGAVIKEAPGTYEVVDLEAQENVNVIPMSEAINPPDAAAKGKSGKK